MPPSQCPIRKVVCIAALLAGLSGIPGFAQPLPPPGGGAPPPQGPGSGPPLQGPPPGMLMGPPLPADAPKPSDDPRDFSGTWSGEQFLISIGKDIDGNPIPFTPEGKRIFDRRAAAQKAGSPFINASMLCRPPGPAWQMIANPFIWHQSKKAVDLSFFYFHGRLHFALSPDQVTGMGTYQGQSVARWSGDRLEVETTGFKDRMWLDFAGTPASRDAKLNMVIGRKFSDHWQLEIVYTIDDPKYYTRPWSWRGTYAWRPDQTLFGEFNCEEQIGGQDAQATAGAQPEPQD